MRENKKQAALDYLKSIHVEYDSDPVIAYCAFIAGTEWMQKMMIDKACKWLLNIDYDSLRYRCFGEEFNGELFVDDFRKAMEE